MKKYSPYLIVLPLAIGALTITGWLFSIDFLKRPFSQLVVMNPTTAFCLLLAALAFILYNKALPKKPATFSASILTATFGATGIIKLLTLFGTDLHVDSWLFHDGVVAENANGHINRMAPNTAFNFVLLALVFFISSGKTAGYKKLANWLAFVIILLSMFSFIGFIYRVIDYYGLFNYLPMAPQTALCFILFALAVLFKNSDYGFMQVISSRHSGGRIARLLIPTAVIVPVTMGFIRLYLQWHFPIQVELGVAALVTSIVVVLLVVVWSTSRSINISDAALQQLKEQYKKMVTEVQDYAIILLDPKGNIENWNLGAEKIKGYRANEIIGKNFSIFHTTQQQQNKLPEKLLEQAIKTGRAVDEGWRIKKDGSTFWASVVITALHGEDNSIIGFSKVSRDLTEKRNAELEMLRQTELFNILPNAIIYGNRDLAITSINKAAESLFDVTPAELVGRRLNDLIESDMTDQMRQDVRNFLWNDGGPGFWKGEITFTTRTGKKASVIATFKTFSGNLVTGEAWVGIYSDVTQLKQTQRRLEAALEGMIAGLWDWNIADNTRWWSPRYFELLGYNNNEIEPSVESLKQLLHPDDVQVVFQSIQNNLLKPERFEHEVRFKLKSGTYRWFKITGNSKFDNNGKPLNMTGAIIDFDDKKQADELIQEQSMLIQMAPDGIVYGSMDNTVISLNESAEKLLETTSRDALGKNLDSFIEVKMIGTTRDEVRKEITEKGYSRHESQITTLTGKKYTVISTVKMVKNIPGHGPGWIAIYNDISPLRLNDELKTANNYLEQLAFISAHDIKSPIHTLGGLSDLLMRSKTIDEKDKELLRMQQIVIHQMQRTNKALNDILKLRKGLLNKDDAHVETLHLGGIINNVINSLHTEIEAASATINLDIKSEYEVQFPLFYMQSIFHNLFSNAVKFREPARPLVISFSAKKLPDNSFCFTITDNGLGFDAVRSKDKIFGIFKRFHAQVEGTGIGLHITKSIIDAFGGTITVTSQPGQGSTFQIILKNPILI